MGRGGVIVVLVVEERGGCVDRYGAVYTLFAENGIGTHPESCG